MDFRYTVSELLSLYALCLHAAAQQCYNLTCTGSGCLQQEVRSNPLLIPKCERIFYTGCFTITTTTGGFTTTTTGCIDRGFDCIQASCSGVTVKTEVTCCNSDLCNDGKPASTAPRQVVGFNMVFLLFAVLFA